MKKLLVVDDSETIRLDVLERVQADPRTAPIPVLLLTTEVQESLMLRAKEAGAKAWLIKPVDPEMLLMAISKVAR